MQRSDLLLGLYILVPVIFLIIPIPTLLLDFLILLNISLALIILFTALFSKEALQMSAFPTILLMTTLFRLSLNVGSTRNILLNGYAGNVVATFGDFVGGGNLIVGVIIFAVLILIQMIVINKGSERVSEVTARFTLDAMPGKQMAIDADLNTGAITDEQAKERRQKIQDEAAFFGSMDGATKYVKGDATAGLIITAINFVGGLVLGIMMQGLSMDEALQKYTILTIGDGLVSQIPSLIISLSTGILVTKVSKESDLGGVLMRQLFSIPKVLYIVGGTMVFLGIGTPLQTWICLVYAVMFIAVGRVMESSMEEQEIEEEVTAEEETAEEIRRPENVVSLLQVDPIELEFGYGIIPLADVNQGGDLLDRVVMIRRQIALELGCVVPMIRLRDNIQLNPNQYVIKIKGVPVSEGEILFDHYMAMNPGYVEEEITGIPTFEPSFHLPALWITEGQRERADYVFSDKNKAEYIIDHRVLFEEIPVDDTKKGKYDLFHAFGVEYPGLMLDLCRRGEISKETFLTVKEDTLRLLAELYFGYVLRKMPCSYDLSGYKSSIPVFFSNGAVWRMMVRIGFGKIFGRRG